MAIPNSEKMDFNGLHMEVSGLIVDGKEIDFSASEGGITEAQARQMIDESIEAIPAPAFSDITDVPAALTTPQAAGTASIRALGTAATAAAAGNHNHAVTAHADSGLAAASTIQALAQALSARIKALEDAAAG